MSYCAFCNSTDEHDIERCRVAYRAGRTDLIGEARERLTAWAASQDVFMHVESFLETITREFIR